MLLAKLAPGPCTMQALVCPALQPIFLLAVPHSAPVCSMVVTDVPCATNPTSEQTTELDAEHQQDRHQKPSQGRHQGSDAAAPCTNGSRFVCLEIENDDTVHTLVEGCMEGTGPGLETDHEDFLSRTDEFYENIHDGKVSEEDRVHHFEVRKAVNQLRSRADCGCCKMLLDERWDRMVAASAASSCTDTALYHLRREFCGGNPCPACSTCESQSPQADPCHAQEAACRPHSSETYL